MIHLFFDSLIFMWTVALLFSGPSGIQPVVKPAPITVHDSDSEDEEENIGNSRACITNNIAQNYSDGEEKNRDPVEIRGPSGVEQLGEGWALLSKIYSLRFSPLGMFGSTPLCSIPFYSLWFSSIYSFVKGILVCRLLFLLLISNPEWRCRDTSLWVLITQLLYKDRSKIMVLCYSAGRRNLLLFCICKCT